MELLLALLVSLGIFSTSPTASTTVNVTSDKITAIQNSSVYKDYIAHGGTDIINPAGLPAISIIVYDENGNVIK